MIDDVVDIAGTMLLIVAPIVLVLIVIVVVMAYPWVVVIPVGIWWLAKKGAAGVSEIPTHGAARSTGETRPPAPTEVHDSAV